MYLPIVPNAEPPKFRECAKHPTVNEDGFVLYYTDQCPFTYYWVPKVREAAKEHGISLNFPFAADEAVKCSNYVGQTIDFAVNMGLKGILFVAHIGKFIKVAGGIMNTHSRDADARMEILAANALRAGADARTAKQILDAVTTDEGLAVLKQTPYWTDTMQLVAQQVEYYLNHRAQGQLIIGAVLYSNAMGELGRTTQAERLLENLIKERKTQL